MSEACGLFGLCSTVQRILRGSVSGLGLSTQGACAVSALFPGKDVVAVTVRRKEDIGTKRKSWALVTFGSEELAMEVLDESTPECVAENVFEGAFLPITMWLNAFNCVFPARF